MRFLVMITKMGASTDSVLLGKPYQGSGLRDTMSDFIVDCLGALITSLLRILHIKDKKELLNK